MKISNLIFPVLFFILGFCVSLIFSKVYSRFSTIEKNVSLDTSILNEIRNTKQILDSLNIKSNKFYNNQTTITNYYDKTINDFGSSVIISDDSIISYISSKIHNK